MSFEAEAEDGLLELSAAIGLVHQRLVRAELGGTHYRRGRGPQFCGWLKFAVGLSGKANIWPPQWARHRVPHVYMVPGRELRLANLSLDDQLEVESPQPIDHLCHTCRYLSCDLQRTTVSTPLSVISLENPAYPCFAKESVR